MASTSHDEDFPVQVGDLLSSKTCIYVVQTFLREGSFGKIAKCLKQDTTEVVAIKILKGHGRMENAQKEGAMLNKLCDLDPDKDNFVRWHDHFLHKFHPCLVFEVMDIDLHDFMKRRDWKPLPLSSIRPITQQLAIALKALKSIGLMHCDLRPNNIMLVDRVRQPLRVKITDFGLSTPTAEAKCGSHIQTRSYRAPEILLGLPFTEAIDMWSLGCVIVELFRGKPLYPASNDYNMIKYIMQTHSGIPHHLLDAGVRTHQFFNTITNMQCGSHSWTLKKPLEYSTLSGISTKEKVYYRILLSLHDLVKLCPPWHQEQLDDTMIFVGLVKMMLELDAARRITPSQVLEHPFVTMKYLLEHHPHSYYVKSCSKALEIRTRQEQSFERCAAVDTQAEENSPIALAEDCVNSCSNALDICIREEQSFEKCAAVDIQAENNSPIALAEDCVNSCSNALDICTREEQSIEWCAAVDIQADNNSPIALAEDCVNSCSNALDICTREEQSIEWCAAVDIQADNNSPIALAEDCVNSCSNALDICTREEQSVEWCAAVDIQADNNSPIALAEDCTLTDSETETPVTPAMQEVKAPSLPRLPQESKAVDIKDAISLLHETKTSSGLSQEIKPLASQQQVNAVDKVPTCLVQEPANLKPAGPVGSSVKCHISVKPLNKRKKYGCFSRFFQPRVNKVHPAGPECSIVKDDLSTAPEKERENHGCFSWLLSPIRQGKQRLTQWLEKQRGFHCRPAQNNK